MQDRIALLDSLYRATLERTVTYQADLKLILADLRDRTAIIDGRLTDIESRMALQEFKRDKAKQILSIRAIRPGKNA